MSTPELQAGHLVEILNRHQVEYVLIGGYAANVHGARRQTQDIDITPATTKETLDRLAAALREMRAGVRVDEIPDAVPFDTSAEALHGMRMLNLRTPYGDIDLTFEPAGTRGYDDLAVNAAQRNVDGVTVRVAARRRARRHHPIEGSRRPRQGCSRPAGAVRARTYHTATRSAR